MKADSMMLAAAVVSAASAMATTPDRSENMTAPLSSAAAAGALSDAFHGYDASMAETPRGVTISWIKQTDKKLNLYCPDVPGNDSDGCFDASASCRMSTIIHNHALPVVDRKMVTFANRKVGVVFNQTLVDQYFGKCSFMYDGGSNNRYNHGCGNGAMAKDINCDSTYSPYENVCRSSNKTCTASDPEVNAVEVDRVGGHADYNTRLLFYKGPAYNISAEEVLTHWDGTQMWETADELRTMVDDRFKVQQTADCGSMCWNEVILDERLILTQLWWDPATVVTAFAYFRGDAGARSQASELQRAFLEQWGVSPPLVSVDTGCNVDQATCAPFYADASGADEVIV